MKNNETLFKSRAMIRIAAILAIIGCLTIVFAIRPGWFGLGSTGTGWSAFDVNLGRAQIYFLTFGFVLGVTSISLLLLGLIAQGYNSRSAYFWHLIPLLIGIVLVVSFPLWNSFGSGGWGRRQLAVLAGSVVLCLGTLALVALHWRKQNATGPLSADLMGKTPAIQVPAGAEESPIHARLSLFLNAALLILACACAGIAILTVILPLWSQTLDDAFITFRFSRNLLAGYGLRWNPLDPMPLEGYTSFLHVLVGALLLKLNLDPVYGTKVFGLVLIGGILTLYAIHTRLVRARLFGFLFVTLLLIANPFFIYAALNGMDTLLAAFMICLCTVLLYASLNERHFLPYYFAACFLCILTRPDTGLLLIAYFAILFLKYRLNAYFLSSALFLLIAPGLVYAGFKFWYFGELFPSSFFFKARLDNLMPQVGIVANFVQRFYIAPFLLLTVLWVIRKLTFLEFAPVLALALALIYYVTIRPAVGIGFRFLIPFLPALLVPLILPVSRLGQAAISKRTSGYTRALAITGVLFVLLFTLPNPQLFRGDIASVSVSTYGLDEAIGKSLAGLPNPQSIKLVTGEGGAIPYYSNMFHIDPYGLVTKDKRSNPFSPDMVFDRSPDIFITHSIAATIDQNGVVFSDPKPIQVWLKYPDVLTAKFSHAIVTDERFKNFEMTAKIPDTSDPGPAGYHYVFIRRDSAYYDLLRARVESLNNMIWCKNAPC